MSDTPTKAEAVKRIEEAQKILEFVIQENLHQVGERLCRIIHCPEWDEIGNLYDQVKALWYKLEDRKYSKKIDLDSEAAAKFLAVQSKGGAA